VHPLLLLHAAVADSRMWAPIRPRLERARRVLAPDALGYGDRPLPKRAFSRVDDVVALLDAERIERAAVVGASDGGRVAIDLALEHPDRVAALVLAAPPVAAQQARVGAWIYDRTDDFGSPDQRFTLSCGTGTVPSPAGEILLASVSAVTDLVVVRGAEAFADALVAAWHEIAEAPAARRAAS